MKDESFMSTELNSKAFRHKTTAVRKVLAVDDNIVNIFGPFGVQVPIEFGLREEKTYSLCA